MHLLYYCRVSSLFYWRINVELSLYIDSCRLSDHQITLCCRRVFHYVFIRCTAPHELSDYQYLKVSFVSTIVNGPPSHDISAGKLNDALE